MIYAYVLRYLLLNTWAWILVAVTWHHSVAGALRPIILRLLLNPSHSALGSAAASLVARAPEDWGPSAILWTKEKGLLKVGFFFKKRVKLWLMHLPGVGVQWPQCTMHKRLQSGLLPAQATASGHFFSHQFVLWRSRQMASRLYHLSWGARLTSFVSCAWVTCQKSSLVRIELVWVIWPQPLQT